jgi:uncharacterized protein YbjT (DUF2867 family)
MADRVLITGGTGFIGSSLARRLIANSGADIRLVGRNFSKVTELLHAGVDGVTADFRDREERKMYSRAAAAGACAG